MQDQLLALEKKYWAAMEDHHYETVKSLTRFPCIIAGKNGVRNVDEAAFKEMFESGAGVKMKLKNISGVVSANLDDNTAVIAYIAEIELEGQPGIRKCANASTWIRQNGSWVCALHTESDLV